MLAVHQEEQEKLYQHIRGVLPDGRSPVSGDSLSSFEAPELTTFVDLRRHLEA